MNKVAVVILLLFTITPVFAQGSKRTTTPNPGKKYTFDTTLTFTLYKNLPKMYLRYREYFDSSDFATHFRVDIRKSKHSKPFQVIRAKNQTNFGPISYDYGDSDPGIQGMFVDINFDGYSDLRFEISEGNGKWAVNQEYDYYIFDSSSFKFNLYKKLSRICNPTPNKKNRIVYEYLRNGSSLIDGTVAEYKWAANNLFLLRSYNYCLFDDDKWRAYPNTTYKKTTVIYKGGKIVRSFYKRIKFKDIPKEHLRYW
jgi:hypothetical protein